MSAILKKPTPTIKKGSGSAEHTDQTEHKEVDILFDRFLEYKSITKGLISYYEDLARLETHTANEMGNIGGHLPVPLREGNQFLPEGGWQSILYDTREQTRAMADYHNTFAHAINHNVLHKLNHVKNDIKLFITDLEMNPDNWLLRWEPIDDPVLIHRQVEAQLKAQLNFENSLTRMIIEYQKKAAELEKRVNVDIQTAVKEFETARITAQEATNKHWQSIHAGITQLDPELEWNEYAERSGHLISESVTMREVSKIAFPGQNDDTTKAIKAGFLERKKRCEFKFVDQSYPEHQTLQRGYYVLTPSGYLHEHKSSDPIKDGEPEMSIFMPNCTIGAPAARGSKTFKWHVEGHKNSSGGVQLQSSHVFRDDSMVGITPAPAKGSFTQATVRSSLPPGEAVTAGLDYTIGRPSDVTRRAAESSDGEWCSSEEEDTVLSPEALSTAPTTPSHLHHERAPSEGLPVYKGGDHTEAPLSTLKEKPEFHPVHDVPQQTVSTS
ncbi:hypothetical protein KEM48_006390 [Puccinia striiformis f. sp. tritici PST-130]|nr:hypothetical protein KEM48_006390 [Puccinia striiformis f. sp. tritici PST-130]